VADGNAPIDPVKRRLAERRLLAAMRRHLKRAPLRADLRVDTLVSELRNSEPTRPSGHRGQGPISLADGELRAVVDGMVADGTLLRRGHRVRLPEAAPGLDPIMRARVDRLVATLEAGEATPPAAEALASRLGIPVPFLDQLRAAGELVGVGPRIDYPRATWLRISEALGRLGADGVPSVRQVRDELTTTRRHAEAILAHWNQMRSSSRKGGAE
jgi:hypothetical protein